MSTKRPVSQTRLYWRLQLAAHYLQKRADRDLVKRAGITTAQSGVLAVIARGKNVTQKQVASALGLNESAVTAMVRRLLSLGYIDRKVSETDARARLLSLTREGREVQKNVRPPFVKINQKIEETLSDKEVERLADYLERLTRSFE